MSALRTISLRLRGTSVEILEEMGEETDNVIESTSKLQEKIKALSGVDILTDAGEYKDTYTILREIGQVWEEMADIDQAALLELMAGKNRANTLSAILSNMTDLEGAYESALHAEGSALKENEAYLDSIQGRIDLFNNSVQTMWMNAINSDAVKDFVDFGAGLINLIDKLGLFESLITSIFTYFTAFSKYKIDFASILGIHDLDAGWFAKKVKDKKSDNIVKTILGDPNDINVSVADFIDAIGDNISNYVTIDTSQIDGEIDDIQKKLATARQQLEVAKKADWNYYKSLGSKSPKNDRDNRIAEKRQQIKALEDDLANLQAKREALITSTVENTASDMVGAINSEKQAYQSMLSVLDQIKDSKLYLGSEQDAAAKIDAMSTAAKKGQTDLVNYVSSLGDADVALKAYAASVNDGNYSLAGFQQFISQHNAGLKASGAAAKVAAIGHQLLNAALSMGISMIASFAIEAFVKGLDLLIVTNDELIQQADELQNTYSSQSKTIKDNISTLQSLEDEFDALSNGVDDYGNNISLATDDYARYKEIVETIVGISPSLIEGYDSEGNAIANKNGLLEESIRLMQEEQRLNAQKLVSDDNLETIGGSIQARLEEYQKENPLPYGSSKSNFMSEFAKSIADDDNYDVFKSLGIDGYKWSDYSGPGADSVYAQNFASDFYDAIVADLRSEESKLEHYFTKEQRENMLMYADEYEKNIQVYNNDIESITKELNSTLQTVPLSETAYYTLSNEMKGYLTQYINGLDVTTENLSDKKREIIELTNFIANNRDVQSILSTGFDLKSGKNKDGTALLVKEYKSKIDEFIKEINKSDYTDEQKYTIFDLIGFDAESKEFNNEISKAILHAKNLLEDRFDEHLNDLSIPDILITTKITEDPNSLTFDELEEKIKEVKIAATEDFSIENYTKMLSAHSAMITEYQEALQKLGKGSFTMDDFVELVEKYPDLARGVDISSNAFYGLSRNLNRAIKSNTKKFIIDLKELRKSLVAAGKSTETIDQLVEAVENMPDDALSDTIQRYSTLADEIDNARLAQDRLLASMEENPNEGYENRGEAMEYMKEAMKRGEIGSESNLWNVAEMYGFTYDSAKTINENADALANYIAVRDTWYKQDDDGNYTYDGTENFIESVDKIVEESKAAETRLAEILEWNYDEDTGAFNFDFDNNNLSEIVELLSETKELVGLTEQEWMDMMVQVGQYFGINWGDYKDVKDHLDEIINSTSDAKTKVEEYGKAMQDYFGQETAIDLTNRPMVSKEDMQAAGWSDFDGEYATLFSGGYSNADDTVAVTVTPILPDGEILGPGALEEYANKLADGTDPAELKFNFNGKEYTGEDIFLKKTEGKNASQIDDNYGLLLSEAQAQYDQLRDKLNINTTINDDGINGLREISELQDAIKEKSDGAIVINEDAFRSALTNAEYTEDQIDLLVEKIKTINNQAFNFDSLNIDDAMLSRGIDGLNEIAELQNAINKDAESGLTIINTDMFASILDGAGYSTEQIDKLIEKVQEYNGVILVSGSSDPLGLNSLNSQIDPLRASLDTLGIQYTETIGTWFDGLTDIKINIPDLVSVFKENNWTDEAIKAYCDQLSQTNIEGFQVKVDPTEVDEAIAKANEIPEEETIKFEIIGNGYRKAVDINSELDKMQSKTIDITINETTVRTIKDKPKFNLLDPSTWADGTAHISGTAHATGSWGAPETETALVGELGPELLVRNGRWTTVGDNGAEFTQVKKGDIIFNHKQTEDLLSKGYVTGRGKLSGGLSAFASGTAFASGGSTFGRYEFDGEGGWTEYDVNNKVVDSVGNAANKISDALDDAADSVEEFEETIDWIEIRMEEYDERIGKLSAQLENLTTAAEKNTKIDEIIAENKKKQADAEAGAKYYEEYAQKYLAGMNSTLVEAAKNGAIAITEFTKEQDEATVKAIQNYRDYAQKAADLHQQAEEIITEIADLAKQAFDNIANEFDNKISLNDSKLGRFESENSLLETDKGWASEDIYVKMQKENAAKIEILKQQRNALQAELDTGKIKKGTDAWYEAVNAIAEVDTEIVNLNTEIEDLQDSINDLNWEQFEFLITQFQAVSDEAENLLDILATKDAVDELGNWTDDGITSLGLLAQQMEVAEKQVSKYEAAIKYLNENWKKLGYTQTEYVERLEELKSGQYDAIKSYNDVKESIRDLNKTRVDAIKDGIEKEIDAYEELIKTKKEALDAEKDLHDFQKNVADQQKNIADIERKLAALSGDNSASARAQRAKLEAELYEAKADLEETYYDRSVSNQQDALDKELESFQDQKEKEIEGWEKYLENLEVVVADSLAVVQENTSAVLATLTAMQDQYGLAITNSLLAPWKAGETAIQEYGVKLNVSLTALAAMFGLTVDEFAAKLGLTTEQLVSNLDITVAQMAASLGLTNEQLAAKLGLTVTDLNSKMNMTIQQLAANMGLTLPALAEKLGTTTAGLAGNLDMTITQFAGRMGLTVEDLANKFGLSTEGLANRLGMTYQNLMDPFGLSMSATVDALTVLEQKYKSILDSINADSRATVDEVNKAMDRYQEAQNTQANANNKQNANTNNSSTTKPTRSEEEYYGVALAIWNGGYGWGTGSTRFKNLAAKGFDANKVQNIVNEMGKDGTIHTSKWRGKYYGIKDLAPYHINKFAKGTNSASKDQWAIIDELGEELQLVPGKNGRLEYIKKGTGIVPADLTKRIVDMVMDPQSMLDRNRPSIGAPHIVNNEINISMDIAEVVHIDHVDHDTLPDLTKAVRKEMDSYMSKVNNAIRSKVR